MCSGCGCRLGCASRFLWWPRWCSNWGIRMGLWRIWWRCYRRCRLQGRWYTRASFLAEEKDEFQRNLLVQALLGGIGGTLRC